MLKHRTSSDIAALNDTVANLVQGMTNLTQELTQVRQVALDAQRLTQAASHTPRGAQSAQSMASTTPPLAQSAGAGNVAAGVTSRGFEGGQEQHLRKMDVKPPIFVGEIDVIKLNSFVFQFESYFRQKGYDLVLNDDKLADEMNQCVQKNTLVCLWSPTFRRRLGTGCLRSNKLVATLDMWENFESSTASHRSIR
ncbi:unnamed protein product [Phytophthora fragariaefolia]|uniref:Unnamed protein product n=1 Tax=Phytophthora fragariaefolia TaxID=1490495 RepID=A0A9W6YCK2_9STRA|nr:unnamed protein product [Phytophthora fragariaefolia]